MNHNKKKTSLMIGILLLLTIVLMSCSVNTQPNKPRVGLILSDLSNPFFQEMKKGAEAEALRQKIDLVVLESENDRELEYKLVETLLATNIELIVINPTDSDGVYKAIKLANDENVPVITIDRASNGGTIVSHIASDNELGGELAAKFMIQFSENKGEYAEFKGIAGTSAAIARGAGFNKYMTAKGKMTLAATRTADFDREKSKVEMEKLLKVHPDLVAVFAHNDEMALGALEAVEAAKLPIKIIGFDGTKEAFDAVEAGRLAGTVVQQPELMGMKAMTLARLALDGKTLEKEVLVEVKLIQK